MMLVAHEADLDPWASAVTADDARVLRAEDAERARRERHEDARAERVALIHSIRHPRHRATTN